MNHDHFHPELVLDPQEQKRLMAHLQQVDTAAFEANRTMLARTVGRVDLHSFQKLATSTALARAHWVSAALQATDKSLAPAEAEIVHLARLRRAYEELSEAYDATRRMIERGYLCYLDKA